MRLRTGRDCQPAWQWHTPLSEATPPRSHGRGRSRPTRRWAGQCLLVGQGAGGMMEQRPLVHGTLTVALCCLFLLGACAVAPGTPDRGAQRVSEPRCSEYLRSTGDRDRERWRAAEAIVEEATAQHPNSFRDAYRAAVRKAEPEGLGSSVSTLLARRQYHRRQYEDAEFAALDLASGADYPAVDRCDACLLLLHIAEIKNAFRLPPVPEVSFCREDPWWVQDNP